MVRVRAGQPNWWQPFLTVYPSKAILDVLFQYRPGRIGFRRLVAPGVTSLNFDTLGLRAELLRAIREQNYETPTPVQREAIPPILNGEDLLAAAQTGTGKTAGFTLPLLQRLMEHEPPPSNRNAVRALILVPTCELAIQVGESIRTYGVYTPIRSTTIFGGVGMQPQLDALRARCDIVVATPGRLLDHVSRKTIDLSKVETLILDEADRMLDMGFIHDIKRVLALLPTKRQNLLFSATFTDPIRILADRLLNAPRRIEVARRNSTADNVEQSIYQVDKSRKPDLLAALITAGKWDQVLVFSRTKHGANKLAQRLERVQITAAAIHGNKSQSARTRALASFKQGEVRVLVATDIAARGLDIDGLLHVVNFDLPSVPEDYVHRIGRTGRAGASGEAISLVCHDEAKLLRDIERLLGHKLSVQKLEGFDPRAKLDVQSDTHPPGRPASRAARPSERPHNKTRRPGRPRRHSSATGQQQTRG